MHKFGMSSVTALLALCLAGCGGGGGGASTTTSGTPSTTSTSTTPSQLTVNVDSTCTLPAGGSVLVAPASAPGAACAAGLATSGSNQVLVSIVYGNSAPYCPAGSALVVSAGTTNCGTLTNSFIPGQSNTITLTPAVNAALAKFQGSWTVSYACSCGGAKGSCSMPIDQNGKIVNGSCQDSVRKITFGLTGAVNQSGYFSGNSTSTSDVFSGQLTAPSASASGSGSGSWAVPSAGDSGPWTATGP